MNRAVPAARDRSAREPGATRAQAPGPRAPASAPGSPEPRTPRAPESRAPRTDGGIGAWAELLRLPALFTVPGDALAGAAAAGVRPGPRTLLA
ncbi:prenyltransferase, partial [Streptomyces coelicoflavus]